MNIYPKLSPTSCNIFLEIFVASPALNNATCRGGRLTMHKLALQLRKDRTRTFNLNGLRRALVNRQCRRVLEMKDLFVKPACDRTALSPSNPCSGRNKRRSIGDADGVEPTRRVCGQIAHMRLLFAHEPRSRTPIWREQTTNIQRDNQP